MTIDVAFQALISLFPGATVALGCAPSLFPLMPLWCEALHDLVSGCRMSHPPPPPPSY